MDLLFGIAEGQEGFFTTRQAAQEGVSRQAIIQAERRGRIERYQRGVYRLRNYPYDAPTVHLWEAVLWPQARTDVVGVLSHETALRLHGLSDVNPRRVHITVPTLVRFQRATPPWLALHRHDLADDEREDVDGLPVTTIPRTLIDIAHNPDIGPAVLRAAIDDAKRRGFAIPLDVRRAGA